MAMWGDIALWDECIVGQSIPMTNNLFLYVEDHNQALYQF